MAMGFLADALDRLRELRPHIEGRIGFVIDVSAEWELAVCLDAFLRPQDLLEMNERNWLPRRMISRTTSDIDAYAPLEDFGVRPGAFADILRRGQAVSLPVSFCLSYLACAGFAIPPSKSLLQG